MSETAVSLVERCKNIQIDQEIAELLWSVDSLVSNESQRNSEYDVAADDDTIEDGLDPERRKESAQLFHRYESHRGINVDNGINVDQHSKPCNKCKYGILYLRLFRGFEC
jgi:hypothetical protein